MIRTIALLGLGLAGAWTAGAGSLPTFQDFRRIDRVRRLTGQMQSAELVAVMYVAPALIERTAAAHNTNAQVLWGAAELLTDWSKQRAIFARAQAVGGTNAAVALRFACAAARHGDLPLAQTWLRFCQTNDTPNLAPWIGEFWLARQRQEPLQRAPQPPSRATKFQDYRVAAARARIQLLEAAGYSRYAARRLGFSADSMLLTMARELGKPPYEDEVLPLLKQMAVAMQEAPSFLLTELVGQTWEGALLAARPDATTSPEVRKRNVEISERREDVKELLANVERNAVDYATEVEMVQYFDTVLSDGEEAAMKWLLDAVKHQPPKTLEK